MKTTTSLYDLVVVGATPGGIACAVTAAREGLSVLLIHPMAHIGGFLTSGAGGWEAPYDGARSPMFDEMRRRISDHYRREYGEGSPQHLATLPNLEDASHLGRPKVEPRVAEIVFHEMLAGEPKITLLTSCEPVEVGREGARLKWLLLRQAHGVETLRVEAAAFADATYEGDLAAVAGVPYRVGREARTEFGEPHAGIIFALPRPEAQPYPDLNLRPMVKASPSGMEILQPESTGAADPSVMAYTYRLILTKDPANRVPVPEPVEPGPPVIGTPGRSIVPGLPNGKIAWNAQVLIGPQDRYPEGSREERAAVCREYKEAVLSSLWHVQHDTDAPAEDRAFWQEYGLAKDEFPDNGHFPYEIYVREARRIVGRHLFTEHDATVAPGLERSPIHADSVAMTDWPLDSLPCTARTVRGAPEGKYLIADTWRPAQVPYRSLLPRELDNLLVPVCLSATHVGWGTIRLEPVWVQTGEAAGLAAALAHRLGVAPAQLDTDTLLHTLVERRAVVSFFNDVDAAASDRWVPAVQYFGTKGFFGSYNARPADPLTPALAEHWFALWSALAAQAPGFDPLAAARRSWEVECAGEAGGSFPRLENFPEGPLSRGEACFHLYQLLPKR